MKSACPDEDSTVMMTAHYDCDCRRWIWGRLPEAPKLDLAICYDFANSSGAPSRRWRCAGRTGYARKSRDGWRRVCYPLWRPRGANPCRTQDQDPHPSDWGHGRCAAQRRQARPLLAGTLAAAGPLIAFYYQTFPSPLLLTASLATATSLIAAEHCALWLHTSIRD